MFLNPIYAGRDGGQYAWRLKRLYATFQALIQFPFISLTFLESYFENFFEKMV